MLVHWSADPIYTVEDREPWWEARPMKPRGLWLSDEGGEYGWKEWCEANNFGDLGKKIAHEVVLAEDANILRVSTVEELDAFTEDYGFNPYKTVPGLTAEWVHGIRWAEVGEQYDGILISPYRWERRHLSRSAWYWGWDCASGCVWRGRAVASITPLEDVSKPEVDPGLVRGEFGAQGGTEAAREHSNAGIGTDVRSLEARGSAG